MLSGRARKPHFSADYSAPDSVQFFMHCRTLSTISQTGEAVSKSWRALSRLTQLTNKKGTSIATSAHFAAIRGVLCVQCFRGFLIRIFPAENFPVKSNNKKVTNMQLHALGSSGFPVLRVIFAAMSGQAKFVTPRLPLQLEMRSVFQGSPVPAPLNGDSQLCGSLLKCPCDFLVQRPLP